MNRTELGRLVRQVWVEWAQEQPDPKPSWLLPWEDIDDGQREVDMRIGDRLFAEGAAAVLSGQARARAQLPWIADAPAAAEEMENFQKCLKPDCFRKVHVGTLYCCVECSTAGEGQYEIERHGPGCDERAAERGEYSPIEALYREQKRAQSRPW